MPISYPFHLSYLLEPNHLCGCQCAFVLRSSPLLCAVSPSKNTCLFLATTLHSTFASFWASLQPPLWPPYLCYPFSSEVISHNQSDFPCSSFSCCQISIAHPTTPIPASRENSSYWEGDYLSHASHTTSAYFTRRMAARGTRERQKRNGLPSAAQIVVWRE